MSKLKTAIFSKAAAVLTLIAVSSSVDPMSTWIMHEPEIPSKLKNK